MGRHGGRGEQDRTPGSADAFAPWDRPSEPSGHGVPAPAPRAATAWPRPPHRRGPALKALVLLALLALGVVLWRLSPSAASAGTVLPPVGGPEDVSSGTAAGHSLVQGTQEKAEKAEKTGKTEASADAGAARLRVHVIGAVKHAGVYALAPGARVEDAIKAAGGAQRRADLSALNLAAPVQDGQQVRVPTEGEPTVGGSVGAVAPSDGSANAVAGETAGATPGVVPINTADTEQLQTLPGIGPTLAARLIAFREQHGRFASPADLDAVPGIGPAMLAKLDGLVSYG